jgi:hypothetical protein
MVLAQAPDPALARMVVDCAMHQRAGSWVDSRLHTDGVLKFNYLYEPPATEPGEYDYRDNQHRIYAAFWNSTRTQGTFLQFIWFRGETPAHLRIVNNAQIASSSRDLELQDALWGVWTYEHLMRRLTKLRAAPMQTASVRDLARTGAVCDSYASPPAQ